MLLLSATLTLSCREELDWRRHNCRTNSMIHCPLPTHCLTTDASDKGWGAMLDNDCIQGTWTSAQQKLHSNQKEMLAILYALQRSFRLLVSSALLIQCDNRTVVGYLRNEGGTKSKSLTSLTMKVFTILDRYDIHLSIYHIPGNYNTHADRLSRNKSPPEWHLLSGITQIIFRKWGVPTIDLFASRHAHVVPAYCTLDRTDMNAIFHDALSLQWDFQNAWVFPPPHLIPRVLACLNRAKGIFLLIVPRWENVYWRPDLKSRALSPPFTIRNLEENLIDTATGHPPSQAEKMTLEVWRCEGGIRK